MARPDFPKTLAQFQAQFRDEAACRRYLAACRWPEGYQCRRCQHRVAFELPRRGLWQCKACGHQSSVTAGTVLHGTRTPLTQWFWAAYLVTTHTPGLSALQLQRQLGIDRYETAWAILHKLRRAMVRPDREPLKHQVEVDETYIGGPEVGLRGGRQLVDKALVVAAVEVRGTASGRVRLQVVPDASGASLTGFVRNAVEHGARRHRWLARLCASHHDGVSPSRPHPRRSQAGGEALAAGAPGLRQPQGGLVGTHHGVAGAHLQVYLDEFTFRFNRRRTPMAAFQMLLGLATLHGPTTYDRLYTSE